MKNYSLAAIALLAMFVCDALAASLSGRVVGVSKQIREGSAWVFTQYLRELTIEDRTLYLEAERNARNERRGLWRDIEPEPPWQWRHERRPPKRS